MNEPQARTPEEEAAGNRRALIGCGSILAVMLALFVGGIYMYRMSMGGDGEVCEQKSDCKPGFECVGDVFEPTQEVCRKGCSSDDDCESGNCAKVIQTGPKDLTASDGVCAPN